MSVACFRAASRCVDTHRYPHGDGDCLPPGCDCGKVPCGFYVWNHSSTAVVNGQTFQQWFIHSYVLNEVGSSPLVSGFFWDDVWNAECNIHDQARRQSLCPFLSGARRAVGGCNV
jgi:hypothetical protein